MEKVRTGRPKISNPRNKNIGIKVSKNDLERFKNVIVKHDIIYLDMLLQGAKLWTDDTRFEHDSINIKERILSIRVTEEEFNYLKTIKQKYKISYYKLLILGLKYYEKK